MKFRKKPVVIEAVQINTQADAERSPGICTGGPDCPKHGPEGSQPHVHTLEGDHTLTWGDWLITGVKGERYFCKPDIFAATYDPVEESAPASVPPEGASEFWSVSSDEEHFIGNFATKEEAIAAAPGELGVSPGGRFWVGKGTPYTIGGLDVDRLFERMSEDAGEECGECAEDWQPVPDAICEAEVYDAVMRCLARTKEVPGFWQVNDIEAVIAPPSPAKERP